MLKTYDQLQLDQGQFVFLISFGVSQDYYGDTFELEGQLVYFHQLVMRDLIYLEVTI